MKNRIISLILACCFAIPVALGQSPTVREVDTLASLAALASSSNVTVFVRRASTADTLPNGTSREMVAVPWDSGATNLNRVRSTFNPNLMWITNSPVQTFTEQGGGNVFTSTTNPTGTIPIWGAGNTNQTDTLISISGKTNLLAGTLTSSNLTSGSVLFSGTGGLVSQDNANLFWNTSLTRLGVGTSNPSNSVHIFRSGAFAQNPGLLVEASGDQAEIRIRNFTDAATGPFFNFGHARGTVASPTVVQDGDRVGLFQGTGWSSNAFNFLGAGDIQIVVDGVPDSGGDTSDMPGRLLFRTTPDGASASVERMRINNAGLVMVGTTAGTEMFNVGTGFKVNSSGNPVQVNGVTQNWPSSQGGALTFLQNDGSGNLSWQTNSAINTAVGTKTLTDNVATDIFTVALAALARSGLEVRFEIDVTNGTDTQTFTDTRRVSAVNKAGTVTRAVSASVGATATSSADTLNVTFDTSSTATTYTIVVTADTTLGTPTLTMRYTILNFNGATITPL